MKAPFAYYGGKAGMGAAIANLLPPHRVYIEPFFGSGAVFFAKRPVPHEIINDLDGAITAFFTCLRDRPDDLLRVCRLTPYGRDEFVGADPDDPTIDILERARRLWVRVNQSYGKTANRRSGFSVTTARTQAPPRAVVSRLDQLHGLAERLALVTIENTDGADLVDRMATSDSVVYVDPPYFAGTRAGRSSWRGDQRDTGGDYRVDMASEEQHRHLATVLHRCPGAVVLSGYPSPLYDELYAGWHTIDRATVSYTANAVTNRDPRSKRTERLWLNYDPTEGRLFGAGT